MVKNKHKSGIPGRAMILAAGKGRRLQPITNDLPKALVKVGEKTMLQHSIEHLKQSGFDQLIINLHHFSGQIKQYLREHKNFGADIAFSEEKFQLLDTGGGLKHASWFFQTDNSFIIRNVDILSNLNLSHLYHFHEKQQAMATLVVRRRESSRYLLFDNDNTLCGWENIITGEKKIIRHVKAYQRLAFSGIHISNPLIFNKMPVKSVFSILDVYLEAAAKHNIIAYIDENAYWFDIGNLEKLEKARRFFRNNEKS